MVHSEFRRLGGVASRRSESLPIREPSLPARRYNLGVAQYLTTDVAAKYLGVTPQRVRQLIVSEKITATKYGRDYVLDSESVKSYKDGRRKPGRPKK